MAKICYLIFIFTSSVLALANCQRDPPSPLCSSSLVSNSSCSQIIYDMISCISFLSAGGRDTKPDGSCCSGFKSVLKANEDCICEAIKDAPQMGIKLNMTRAAKLPYACGVSHFSISKTCGFSESPGAPPVKPPKSSPKSPEPPPKTAPIPSSKSPAPSPRTKITPAPTPTAPKAPIKSPKSPISSLPKFKSPTPSPVAEEGLNQVPAPAPTDLKSGSYSINVCFEVFISICAIYLFTI